jgi:phosphate transport system substrate-binding protein
MTWVFVAKYELTEYGRERTMAAEKRCVLGLRRELPLTRVFGTGRRCIRSCHSEERSDEESAFALKNKKKQIPRSARNDRLGRTSITIGVPKAHVTLGGMLPLLAVVMFVALLAACTKPATNAAEPALPAGSILLTGAGATFPSPLYSRWFTTYHQEYPQTYVKYSPVGSAEGVRRFIGKDIAEGETVDFGASDAAMQDPELAQADNNVLMLPATAGCVVLAYNLPDFHGTLRLSRQAYTGIFLGEIKNWNDPLIAQSNPGTKLPDLTIATVVRQDGSGTTFAFTKHLDAISERWRSQYGPATLVNWPGNAMRASKNEGVAGLIEKSEGSIGYVAYEFARRIALPVAILENKDGKFVEPSAESCAAALATVQLPDNLRAFVPDPSGENSYPIVTFSWILLHKKYASAETAAAIRDLFRWCLLDGQKYAPALDYLPLPASVAQKALVALNSINSGG